MLKPDALDVLFLLGADEVDPTASKRVPRLSGQPWRPRRARRRRDPAGCGLYREVRPVRQHRGPGADGRTRRLPQGRGERRLGHPARAVGQASARPCPTTPWTQLRAKLMADHPTFGRIDYLSTPAAFDTGSLGEKGDLGDVAVHLGGARPLSDQPDHARQRDHGRAVRPADRPGRHGGGVKPDGILDHSARLDPATIGGILLITVGILIDRSPSCCWPTARSGRACRCAKAPTSSARSACCSPSPTCFKFVLKEPIIVPAGADKMVFLLAPLLTFILAFIAWAAIPFAPGWVISDMNVGILYIFAISSAGRLRHHHGRLGFELEVSVPGRCARRRRWCPMRSPSAW